MNDRVSGEAGKGGRHSFGKGPDVKHIFLKRRCVLGLALIVSQLMGFTIIWREVAPKKTTWLHRFEFHGSGLAARHQLSRTVFLFRLCAVFVTSHGFHNYLTATRSEANIITSHMQFGKGFQHTDVTQLVEASLPPRSNRRTA